MHSNCGPVCLCDLILISVQMRDIEITHEPIELYKILKFEGMVSSGGEAKAVIADGLVTVNGLVETKKRKKIVSGDIVRFGKEEVRVLHL